MNPLNKISMILALTTSVGLISNQVHAIPRDKLSEIRTLVTTNNIPGLMSFISGNPEVLDNSPLGQSLADFAKDPPDAVERFFGARVPDDLSEMAAKSATDPSLY